MPKQLKSNVAVVGQHCVPTVDYVQRHITLQPKFLSCWDQARATVELHDVMRSPLGLGQKFRGFVQTFGVLHDGLELLPSRLGLLLHNLLHMGLLHWPRLRWSCLRARLRHGSHLSGMLMRAEVQRGLDAAAWGQQQLWAIFLGLKVATRILQFQRASKLLVTNKTLSCNSIKAWLRFFNIWRKFAL